MLESEKNEIWGHLCHLGKTEYPQLFDKNFDKLKDYYRYCIKEGSKSKDFLKKFERHKLEDTNDELILFLNNQVMKERKEKKNKPTMKPVIKKQEDKKKK